MPYKVIEDKLVRQGNVTVEATGPGVVTLQVGQVAVDMTADEATKARDGLEDVLEWEVVKPE